MKRRFAGSLWMTVSAVALLALLAVLAVLQYRWIGQVSQAERERMQANLRTATTQFSRDFTYELARVGQVFQVEPGSGRDWERYAAQYEHWIQTSQTPRLVRGVSVIEAAESGDLRFLRLNTTAGRFESAAWPAQYGDLRRRLEAVFQDQRFAGTSVAEEIPALVLPLIERPPRDRGGPGFPRPRERSPGPRPSLLGYAVVELDLDFLQNEMFPDLTRRHFAGLAYQVAILSRYDNRVIFGSEPGLSAEHFSSPDASVELLSRPRGEGPGPLRPAFARFGPGGPPWGGDFGGHWQLVVKHRSGSLEMAVAEARYRNLAISFGILLLLGSSVAMMVVSTRRAQRLARLQIEFVTGVSHELRTPLSVICSASDNLASGVVSGERSQQYGSLIRNEGRRLAAMVDQILAFATAQSDRGKYELRPVEVPAVIESALASSGAALQQEQIEVTRQIDPNLPPVLADQTSLENSIQNLLSNAMKYAKDGGRLIVRAEASEGEVRISVEDKGPGIDPGDIPHIFEPFYRGARATAAQIHGTGLGLSLVQRIMEAHGGRVTVKSVPGEGSTFTLHLPAAPRQ